MFLFIFLRILSSTRWCMIRHRRLCWPTKERSEWDLAFRQMYLKCCKKVLYSSYCRFNSSELNLLTYKSKNKYVLSSCLRSFNSRLINFSLFIIKKCYQLSLDCERFLLPPSQCKVTPVQSLRYMFCIL